MGDPYWGHRPPNFSSIAGPLFVMEPGFVNLCEIVSSEVSLKSQVLKNETVVFEIQTLSQKDILDLPLLTFTCKILAFRPLVFPSHREHPRFSSIHFRSGHRAIAQRSSMIRKASCISTWFGFQRNQSTKSRNEGSFRLGAACRTNPCHRTCIMSYPH